MQQQKNAEAAAAIALGIDGGGTRTSCCALDSSARLLGHSVAGSSNKNSVGEPAALENLRQAMQGAVAAAGAADLSHVVAVCACISGVDSPVDAARLRVQLQAILPPGTAVWVQNDAVAALAAGTGGELEGCVLIAGTGTIAFGMRAGASARAAGWGGTFLDGGSGYDLGQRALAAVARAADGRGPPTALLPALCAACGVDEAAAMEGLLAWAYGAPAAAGDDAGMWGRVAALAPCVTECAATGDGVATSLLDQGAAELVGSLQAVCRKLGFEGGPNDDIAVVLSGGLLAPGGVYATRLAALVRQRLSATRVVHPSVSPEQGAAMLALRQWQQAQAWAQQEG